MLINLPDSVYNLTQLEDLIDAMQSQKFNSEPLIEDFFEVNYKLKPSVENNKKVIKCLKNISKSPKIIRITFAQNIDSDFFNELLKWLRSNISSQLLVEIVIDPSIIGGIILRSPVREYDFSWKKILETKRQLLNKKLAYGIE